MRYLALVTDYDGTLADEGQVAASTLVALRRLRESGRRLVLVSGRELPDLIRVFPDYALFDRIVAENGALLFCPETHEEQVLGEPPPSELSKRLAARGVEPLSVGRVIVATWSPHETTVLEVIRELGLELQLIFNKGAVMVLPSGVNKATGLRAALKSLSLSAHNAVAVGDAENDHALLAECEVAVAVANALPMLKERADLVTTLPRGAGVCELVESLLVSDLRELAPRLSRHDVALGTRLDDEPLNMHPYGHRVLVCGTSGSGKSTLVTSFLERLSDRGYQFCLVDPEGDFHTFDNALVLGNEQQPPTIDEVASVLQMADKNVIVALLGVPLERRSEFFVALMARAQESRARTGRPHWFVVDEAHHMLPAGDVAVPHPIAHPPSGLLLITVHPDRLAASVLESVDTLIVVGSSPLEMITSFANMIGRSVPELPSALSLEPDEALFWSCRSAEPPLRFRPIPPKQERRRHHRKYATGELGEDKSFFFRGARDQLKLRAHNLTLFLQIGDGVDEETWLHHLRQHDYSRWVREAIKNDALADEIDAIEREESTRADARPSRERIRQAVERVYTLPA
jgi:HAD superfamily hydrolase (TIGR01484 family)